MNDHGLTLIELVASITILAIVLLTFMSFFTNAFKYNSMSSTKLQSINIIHDVENCLKENPNFIKNIYEFKNPIFTDDKCKHITNFTENVTLKNNAYVFSFIYLDYEVSINVMRDPEFPSLYPSTIEVYDNDKKITESYTYFKEEGT